MSKRIKSVSSVYSFDPNRAPTPDELKDPLLSSLARLSSYQIPCIHDKDTVIPMALALLGIDVDALPPGWAMRDNVGSLTGKTGLNRRMSTAFCRMKKNPTQHFADFVEGNDRGQWGLKQEGLDRARTLASMWPEADLAPKQDLEALRQSWAQTRDELSQARQARLAAQALEAELEARLASLVDSLGGEPEAAQDDAAGPQDEAAPETAQATASDPCEPQKAVSVRRTANVTARFLERRLIGGQRSDLYKAVTFQLKRKMRVSSVYGMIDDHAQEFFANLIHRDALAGRIAAGDDIPNSWLASCAVNSARNDARNNGSNPVCRELMGARTDRERRSATIPMSDPEAPTPVWERDGDDGPATVQHFVDTKPWDPTVSDQAEHEAMFEVLSRVMKVKKPQAWSRYVGIVVARADGHQLKDIAVKEKVSRNRAATMLAEARKVLREAVLAGELDDLTRVRFFRSNTDCVA